MFHMHDRKSEGFAQRLIRPPEQRATKKPLLAGQDATCCRFEYISIRYVYFNVHTLYIFFPVLFIYLLLQGYPVNSSLNKIYVYA